MWYEYKKSRSQAKKQQVYSIILKAKTHNKDIKAMNINTPNSNTSNSRVTMFKKQQLQKINGEIKT